VTGVQTCALPICSAPTRTIAQLKVPNDFRPTRFKLTFQPYGWAPDGSEGKRLAVIISAWEPTAGASKDVKDLTNVNALLSMASYQGSPIATGGRYEGTVEVRATEPGRGTLYLMSVNPTR